MLRSHKRPDAGISALPQTTGAILGACVLLTRLGLPRSRVPTPGHWHDASNPLYQVCATSASSVAARISNLIALLPLWDLALGLAFYDGAMCRAVRRFNIARESSTIYHRAKYANVSAMSIPLMIYLWIPTKHTVWGNALLLVLMSTSALLYGLQIKFYKKYL